MNILNSFKFLLLALLISYFLFFILLYLGSTEFLGFYNSFYKSGSFAWYMKLVWFADDYGSYFYNFPYVMSILVILLKVFKCRIYLFYPTLFILIIDFVCAEFFWGCWNPY